MSDISIEHEIRIRKELDQLGEEVAPIFDDAINEGSEVKKRGFVIFIIDYFTGVVHMRTSVNSDDALELLRFWVKTEDEKKLKELN